MLGSGDRISYDEMRWLVFNLADFTKLRICSPPDIAHISVPFRN
jgi:hypothetical protein